MTTCTHANANDPFVIVLEPEWADHQDLCGAPALASCQGTDWPPLTSWQRYAAERAAGERVPPSVSVWREQDRRRQAAQEREARERYAAEREEQAPDRSVAIVAWGPGPSCEAP